MLSKEKNVSVQTWKKNSKSTTPHIWSYFFTTFRGTGHSIAIALNISKIQKEGQVSQGSAIPNNTPNNTIQIPQPQLAVQSQTNVATQRVEIILFPFHEKFYDNPSNHLLVRLILMVSILLLLPFLRIMKFQNGKKIAPKIRLANLKFSEKS